jgi:hypothetical protein
MATCRKLGMLHKRGNNAEISSLAAAKKVEFKRNP